MDWLTGLDQGVTGDVLRDFAKNWLTPAVISGVVAWLVTTLVNRRVTLHTQRSQERFKRRLDVLQAIAKELAMARERLAAREYNVAHHRANQFIVLCESSRGELDSSFHRQISSKNEELRATMEVLKSGPPRGLQGSSPEDKARQERFEKARTAAPTILDELSELLVAHQRQAFVDRG